MHRIGVLIFPGFELLDVFGPMEMFGLLPDKYELCMVAETPGPVASNQRLSAYAEHGLHDDDTYDILFVPGGAGTRKEIGNRPLLRWIAEVSAQAEYTLSVCTGSALLARAGLLDGRKAATNKSAFSWVEEQGPKVKWQRQARWVEDGPFITSSGVTAGMDMALGAIALMHGQDTARDVARWCEYTWQEDKTNDPFARMYGLV
ncbi:DJ-1/PfpI family protein [Ruegeria sp. 2012CJ41-6]|uniref:DJ-1/PfpI family protein n=1 Tax=Ruegeria spongiae TaxID=2942209 RepID=A0ABT0Q0A0_9RHOB|nr:DJ-1/PfpI family protein [Ruegeria spongiae]MCL6283236.1 DJ-1/PfpI family protein [Ruegeria spongiae]